MEAAWQRRAASPGVLPRCHCPQGEHLEVLVKDWQHPVQGLLQPRLLGPTWPSASLTAPPPRLIGRQLEPPARPPAHCACLPITSSHPGVGTECWDPPHASFSPVTLSQPLACRPASSTPKPELPEQEVPRPSAGMGKVSLVPPDSFSMASRPQTHLSSTYFSPSPSPHVGSLPLGSGLLPVCSPNSSQRERHTVHIR